MFWIVAAGTKQAVKDAPDKIKEELIFELREIKAQVTKLLTITK